MSSSSSLLFTLRELSQMEEERVRSAAEAAAHEQQRREQIAREEEARASAALRARQEAEEEARHDVERRAREEAARIAAIHRAAADAARVEAEARVLAEEREQQRRHALEVEQARALASRRGRRPALTWAGMGALATGCLAAALHLGLLVPRAEASLRSARSEAVVRDVAIAQLRARADLADQRLVDLQAALTTANDEVTRLRAQLDARPASPHAPSSVPGTRGGPGPRRGERQLDGLTTCPPGSQDPLCMH